MESSEDFIQLSNRMTLLPPYLFGRINKIKLEKRKAGIDIIDLGMGNPTDATPKPVIEKLCEVVQDRRNHRYSVATGIHNLRLEIANYYERHYGVSLDPGEEVIATIGSKEGISHLSLALLDQGDVALVPVPAFPIHIYSVIIAGGNVLRIPLGTDEAFLRQVDYLCRNFTPSPKVLILNLPHNPTAKTVDLGFFEEAVRIAKKNNLILVQDFAYARVTFDGYRSPSLMDVQGAKAVGVEFGTFSKSYNMAGWRVGYCVGNSTIVKALEKIKGYFDYGLFQAVQIAAIIALRDCEDAIARQAALYQKRRDIVVEGLRCAGWEIEKPRASMFVWARIPEPFRDMGSLEFSIKLLEEAEVAVAPGIGFGPEGEGYLRIALVENENRLRQAVRQIKRMSTPKPREKRAPTSEVRAGTRA